MSRSSPCSVCREKFMYKRHWYCLKCSEEIRGAPTMLTELRAAVSTAQGSFEEQLQHASRAWERNARVQQLKRRLEDLQRKRDAMSQRIQQQETFNDELESEIHELVAERMVTDRVTQEMEAQRRECEASIPEVDAKYMRLHAQVSGRKSNFLSMLMSYIPIAVAQPMSIMASDDRLGLRVGAHVVSADEDYAAMDTGVATQVLSHLCLVVHLMAQYLEVVLPHTMVLRGSETQIAKGRNPNDGKKWQPSWHPIRLRGKGSSITPALRLLRENTAFLCEAQGMPVAPEDMHRVAHNIVTLLKHRGRLNALNLSSNDPVGEDGAAASPSSDEYLTYTLPLLDPEGDLDARDGDADVDVKATVTETQDEHDSAGRSLCDSTHGDHSESLSRGKKEAYPEDDAVDAVDADANVDDDDDDDAVDADGGADAMPD